jgi:hypothetical protein
VDQCGCVCVFVCIGRFSLIIETSGGFLQTRYLHFGLREHNQFSNFLLASKIISIVLCGIKFEVMHACLTHVVWKCIYSLGSSSFDER